MTRDDRVRGALPRRVALIGLAAGLMAALVVLLQPTRGGPGSQPAAIAAPLVPPQAPIAAEAGVFRTRLTGRATGADPARRRAAHPRTLATWRTLRAYQGAPPRVPHGLTADELRTTSCNTCHEHGGYSQRFGAYAPVTPHPEQAACLQCHATDAAVVGVALPGRRPDDSCRQCHAPAAPRASVRLPGWAPAAWPERLARDGLPAPIPHDLGMRGTCLACHMGPGAVAEIRTTHPERADCRQCHVAASPAPALAQSTATDVREAGGTP